MEQWEKDPELNLEDIIKEFCIPEESAPETVISKEEDPDADVVVWDGKPITREKKSPAIPQDTVRLDAITREIKKQETVRLDEITKEAKKQESTTQSTIAFTPVHTDEDEDVTVFIPQEAPKTEPYSQEWEPEYEEPMGEYVPQEPIVFQPKSRARELKKKLMIGPEKRYHALAERGFGKLQAAIFGCAMVSLLSVLAAAMHTMGIVPDNRMRLLVFGQLFGLLMSALLGSYQLMEGFGDLLKRRFSLNTLLLFSMAACLADSILCLINVDMPCCVPFSLNMTMSLWRAYHDRSTELGQMDTMRKATRLRSVIIEEDYFDGKPGILRGEGMVEDFMDTYRAVPGPMQAINLYALIALFLSVGIGVTAGVLSGFPIGVRMFSASLLMAAPATAYIAVSRPMAVLERRLHKLGVVLCGWNGVLAAQGKLTFPVSDGDLFPEGTVKLNGTKFYGSRNPDQVVAYTAAVMIADGGGLAPLFSQLLESRNGYHFEVQTLRHYPNGGVGGIVNDEAVLIGTLSFMNEMHIQIPESAKVNQAVYAAVDGVLNGVYVFTYSVAKPSAAGLSTLCAYRDLTPVMLIGDFMLTEEFLHQRLGVRTHRMAFPEHKNRKLLASHEPSEDAQIVALTTKEEFAGTAYAITGARALRTACIVGVAVQMMGGILGLLIMLALTIVQADYLVTAENLLLYALIWTIPGLLITEWTRSI